MNIFNALLQISLLCQLGPGSPPLPAFPASAVLQQVNTASDADNRRSYGWKIDDDGELCFIVQVSVEEVQKLASLQQEKFSNMPVELIGRVTRICVHVGNDLLPREPSLEAISKMPIQGSTIASMFGEGKLSDVESPVVMAQDGRTPTTLPQMGSDMSPGGNDLINRMDPGPRGGQTTLPGSASQDFLGATRNSDELAAIDPANGFPPTVGKFNSTAGTAPPRSRDETDPARRQPIRANPPASNAEPSMPAFPRVADAWGNAAGQNQYQGNYNYDPQLAPDPNSMSRGSYGNGQGFPGQSLNDRLQNQANNQAYASNPNTNPYASDPNALNRSPAAGYPNGAAYPYAAAPNYPAPPTPSTATGLTEAQRQLLASNAGQPGSTATNAAPTPTPSTPQTNQGTNSSPRDSNAGQGASSKSKSSSQPNQFLQVFFLLSLVVNFYLAVLIRKLLTRYRSLLSSVRSQTA